MYFEFFVLIFPLESTPQDAKVLTFKFGWHVAWRTGQWNGTDCWECVLCAKAVAKWRREGERDMTAKHVYKRNSKISNSHFLPPPPGAELIPKEFLHR